MTQDNIALQNMFCALSRMDGYTLHDNLFVAMEQEKKEKDVSQGTSTVDDTTTTTVSNGSLVKLNGKTYEDVPGDEYGLSVLIDTGNVTEKAAPLNVYSYDYGCDYGYDYNRNYNFKHETSVVSLRNEDIRRASRVTIDVDIDGDIDIGISDLEECLNSSSSPQCSIDGCKCLTVNHMDSLCGVNKEAEDLQNIAWRSKEDEALCVSEGDFEEIALRNENSRDTEDPLEQYTIQTVRAGRSADYKPKGEDEYEVNRARLKSWFDELTNQYIQQLRGEEDGASFAPPNSRTWILQGSEL